MPAETLIPLDELTLPPPALLPASAAVLLDASGLSEALPSPGARLAYLFRRCQAHPLRQILADHRGVQE